MEIKATCMNCGLPLVQNHHPDAGKPEHINRVGCPSGCLPCAEKRATGRGKLIAELDRWLEAETRAVLELSRSNGGVAAFESKADAFEHVREKLKKLEESRRADFRASS